MKIDIRNVKPGKAATKRRKTGPKVKPKNSVCIVCNTPINDANYSYSLGSNFCSWPCYESHKQDTSKPNCECTVCKKPMYLKPSRLERVRNGIACSRACGDILRRTYMAGTNNHQFGLRGHLNASFIGEDRVNQYGYNMKYLPNHPLADRNGRYREHRYIVEQDLTRDEIYFKYIDNTRVLKEEFDIHHINENRLDNRPNNLEILTRSEHVSMHNKQKCIIRDNKGRIIGVVKRGELLENLEVDNQQPSIDSNIDEGSMLRMVMLTRAPCN